MNKTKRHGIDASNEISLFDYGLLINDEPDEDGQYFIVYRQGDEFGTGYMSESEVNDITNESWFDKCRFFSYVGMSEVDWVRLDIARKLFDLFQYYGTENVIGMDYSPISEEKAREYYL